VRPDPIITLHWRDRKQNLEADPSRIAPVEGKRDLNYQHPCIMLLAQQGGDHMVKVKTFTTPLRVFETVKEIAALDEQVNQFIKDQKVTRIVSISDACTTDANGATIGLIRVVTFEQA